MQLHQRGGVRERWAKWVEGNGKNRLPVLELVRHRVKRNSIGTIVSNSVVW